MLSNIKATQNIARREWLQFTRSRPFLIFGLLVPLAITSILWILIVSNGNASVGGDRWKYFQSEVSRFEDDVKGTYNFEKSEDRMLFYIVDHANLDIDIPIQEELLRRDLASMIDYLKDTPLAEWKWFVLSEEKSGIGPKQLWAAVSNDTFTPEELISTYSLEHDELFSSRLATTDENYSWFVGGWNENIEDIAQTIPSMSFSRVVQVFEASDAWVKSVWVPAYIEIPMDFLETRQVNCVVSESWFSFVWAHPERDRKGTLQGWFEELIGTASNDYFQLLAKSNGDDSLVDPTGVHLELNTDDSLNDIERKHERTQWLSSFVFTSVYLLCIVGAWILLYFDPNLKSRDERPVMEPSYHIMDGRVLGTMLKMLSILSIWIVLLFLPLWLLLGTMPAFGVGALAIFFHPLFLLNYLIFFVLGLMTYSYAFHVLGLLRRILQSLVFMLFSVNITLLATSSSYMANSWPYDFFCFLPFVGSVVMLKRTFVYPDTTSYIFIVLIAVVFLIGCRFYVKSEEQLRYWKKELKYGYHSR